MILVTVDWGAFLSQLDLDLFIPTPAAGEQKATLTQKLTRWLVYLFHFFFFLAISLSNGSFSFFFNIYLPPLPFSVPYI